MVVVAILDGATNSQGHPYIVLGFANTFPAGWVVVHWNKAVIVLLIVLWRRDTLMVTECHVTLKRTKLGGYRNTCQARHLGSSGLLWGDLAWLSENPCSQNDDTLRKCG